MCEKCAGGKQVFQVRYRRVAEWVSGKCVQSTWSEGEAITDGEVWVRSDFKEGRTLDTSREKRRRPCCQRPWRLPQGRGLSKDGAVEEGVKIISKGDARTEGARTKVW